MAVVMYKLPGACTVLLLSNVNTVQGNTAPCAGDKVHRTVTVPVALLTPTTADVLCAIIAPHNIVVIHTVDRRDYFRRPAEILG